MFQLLLQLMLLLMLRLAQLPASLRIWLNENEIFFDTVAALAVGIAATLVAWASHLVGREANKIARKQLEAAEAQTFAAQQQARAAELQWAPHLYCTQFNEGYGSTTDVINDGAPLANWEINDFAFLLLFEKNRVHPSMAVPIHYHHDPRQTGQSIGVIAKLYPRSPYFNESNEPHIPRLECEVGGTPIARISVRSFIRINYFDRLGIGHEQFFHLNVPQGSSLTRIEPMKGGKELLGSWDSTYRDVVIAAPDIGSKVLELHNLSAPLLLRLFEFKEKTSVIASLLAHLERFRRNL